LWVWLARRLGGVDSGPTISVLIRLTVAGVLTVIAVTVLRGLLVAVAPLEGWSAQLTSFASIVVLGSIGTALFIVLAWALRVREVSRALAMVTSKVVRR
jgi:hypothetical protein